MAIPLTARAPVEFTPPTLPKSLQGPDPKDESRPKVRIVVRVPTMMERDTYAATLVRAGVHHYTRRQIRDLSLAGVQALFPEDEHEEKQALLMELWADHDAQQDLELRAIQMLREETEKAKAAGTEIDSDVLNERLKEMQPEVVMDRRRRIDGTSLSQEVLNRFEPLGQAVAALAEQDAKRAWINARVYVLGWKGLESEPDPPGPGGLKQGELNYLRSQIGQPAFFELSEFITAMMNIDEDEEKNLASLLENMSAPTGSTPLESTASSDDGNSTGGPSTTTRANGSRKTTASSSRSGTRSKARKGAKSGRTGAASSTSPPS